MTTNSVGHSMPLTQIHLHPHDAQAFAEVIILGTQAFLYDGYSAYFEDYKKSLGDLLTYSFMAFEDACYPCYYEPFMQALLALESFPAMALINQVTPYCEDYFQLKRQLREGKAPEFVADEIKRWQLFSSAAYKLNSLTHEIRHQLAYMKVQPSS